MSRRADPGTAQRSRAVTLEPPASFFCSHSITTALVASKLFEDMVHSYLHTPRQEDGSVPSPPAPALCEIWLLSGHGESCACRSDRRAWSSHVVLPKNVLSVPAVVATLSVGTAIDCRRQDDDDVPTASARAVFSSTRRLLFSHTRLLLSQGAVAATGIGCDGCSGSRIACGERGLVRVAPTQRRQPRCSHCRSSQLLPAS